MSTLKTYSLGGLSTKGNFDNRERVRQISHKGKVGRGRNSRVTIDVQDFQRTEVCVFR